MKKHLINAWQALWQTKNQENPETVVTLMNNIEIKHTTVKIKIQNGTIPQVGINGVQAADLLEFTKELFVSLNNDYPCKENNETILLIQKAVDCQKARTRDREARKVEGTHNA